MFRWNSWRFLLLLKLVHLVLVEKYFHFYGDNFLYWWYYRFIWFFFFTFNFREVIRNLLYIATFGPILYSQLSWASGKFRLWGRCLNKVLRRNLWYFVLKAARDQEVVVGIWLLHQQAKRSRVPASWFAWFYCSVGGGKKIKS